MTQQDERSKFADRETRGAFTFRRMEQWQVWALSAVAVLVLIVLIGSYVV